MTQRWWTLAYGLAILILLIGSPARAAGGPENVLLVVNFRSPDSLCIANHYAALRHIPGSNFLFLDWDPKQDTTDVKTFRDKILLPAVRTARIPVPGREIDYIVYSSGFPWGIHIDDDMKKFSELLEQHEKEPEAKPGGKSSAWLKYMTPMASPNGLTYLYEPVLSGNFYVNPFSNWYARTGLPNQKDATISFSSVTGYGMHGEATATAGRHYFLSMMLGVTGGRGNTLDEVLGYLKRSAAADGTNPKGTIYYVQNGDVRSKVRQAGFPAAVKELQALGVKAEIIEGTVPQNKPDVQGAMLGVADFDWKSSGSTILPGAICEHFTSFGGIMSADGSQTPLSEFLRYGAAAASGTVTEPYSIAQKFPAPAMHVHYARGCTVAESFYQSVLCPYQLLIVGDPLCRPWADIPEITVGGLAPGGTVSGDLKLAPQARFSGAAVAEHFDLVLDGQKVAECKPGGTLLFDTALMSDGAHEVRVVAASKGPVIARGEKILEFSSANHGRTIEATCLPEKKISEKETLLITVKAPKASVIRVLRGTRLLATINDEAGQIKIPAAALGRGPVRLTVVGLGDTEPRNWAFARPLDIEVEE